MTANEASNIRALQGLLTRSHLPHPCTYYYNLTIRKKPSSTSRRCILHPSSSCTSVMPSSAILVAGHLLPMALALIDCTRLYQSLPPRSPSQWLHSAGPAWTRLEYHYASHYSSTASYKLRLTSPPGEQHHPFLPQHLGKASNSEECTHAPRVSRANSTSQTRCATSGMWEVIFHNMGSLLLLRMQEHIMGSLLLQKPVGGG